jgi:hypothetical protein
MEQSFFARMVLVYWIVFPKLVVMGINSLDSSLYDGVAARKTRKLRDIDCRTLEWTATYPSGVDDSVVFCMADHPQFLICITQNLLIVV